MSEGAAHLVLADGTIFSGRSFGARTSGEGEVVFHTGLTGYQEILTDPSYAGQIVCMTYPEIGNVGVNAEDEESRGLFLSGLVIRDLVEVPSSWRAEASLPAYLERHGIPGLYDIDTRALVRRLRSSGAMNGVLVHGDVSVDELRQRAAAVPSMEGRDLVRDVSCRESYVWSEGSAWLRSGPRPGPSYRVVAYDFGIKRNILRMLFDAGLDVTVVPSTTPAADVLAMKPDGVFLSNGPGDPAALAYAVEAVGEILGRVPILGICLGHQILAQALGGTTCKLRFGHHGANQPARETDTGRVMITSENHGFAVDAASLRADPDLEITYLNLNDQTVEGLRHRPKRAFSVQYHPEASPGPHDTEHLFREFRSWIEGSDAQAR